MAIGTFCSLQKSDFFLNGPALTRPPPLPTLLMAWPLAEELFLRLPLPDQYQVWRIFHPAYKSCIVIYYLRLLLVMC